MPGSEHNWKHFITQRLVGKFITEDITTFFYLDSKEDAETEIEWTIYPYSIPIIWMRNLFSGCIHFALLLQEKRNRNHMYLTLESSSVIM